MTRRYGWKPDAPDARDRVFRAPYASREAMPPVYSQRAAWWPCWDQGNLGSCTPHSVCGLLAYRLLQDRRLSRAQVVTPEGTPSRLATYYNARSLAGTVPWDSGVSIRDGIKALASWGAASESLWPYDVRRFKVRPPKQTYTRLLGRALYYLRVNGQDQGAVKAAIASGFPVAFGFSVYDSFDQVARTGLMPVPDLGREKLQGGHAVVRIGWDDRRVIGDEVGAWECRNSWGPAWGDQGHFWMPYSFGANPDFCDDFWVIEIA